MYRYDEFDKDFVAQRVDQFADQDTTNGLQSQICFPHLFFCFDIVPSS